MNSAAIAIPKGAEMSTKKVLRVGSMLAEIAREAGG